MRPLLCLLSSPLLGRAVWTPVASELARLEWETITATGGSAAPRNPRDVVEAFLDVIPVDRPVVLVPHSNAGLYVPALIAHRDVVANVFVDAGLPPGDGAVRVTPPELYAFLSERVDDKGLLPPWTQWWDETDVAALFPNDDVRRRVEDDQRSLPLSYFSHSVDVPEGWDDVPSAYLAFGDTYAAEKAEADGRGWRVRTLPGNHLHMLIEPHHVAAEITSMLPALGVAE